MRTASLITLLAALALAAAAEDTWAQNLAPGSVVRGQLQNQQSSNVHMVNLTAGDKVVIRVKGSLPGIPAPAFQVVGPDLVPIASMAGRRVNRVVAIALVTGPHQITVAATPGSSLGYVLRIVPKRVAPYQPPAGGTPAPQPPPGLPVPPVGPATRTHFYLPAAMLGGERGDDLSAAEGMIDALADEPAGLALDELQTQLADPIIGRIFHALAEQGLDGDALGRAGLERVLDVLDASRRADAAEIRLAKLGDAAAGTRLAGDAAFSAGMSMAAAAIAETRAAIDQEIDVGIPGKGQEPASAGLAAPDATATRLNLAGRATLERIVMGTLMSAAQGGERDSADAAMGLYEVYATMLAEGSPLAVRRRANAERALDELRGILRGLATPLELETEALPAPGIGEPFDILVRLSGGMDQSQVSWDVEGHDGMNLEPGPEGLRIQSAGELGPRTITVRAAHEGREGEIEVYVEPQHEPKPLIEVIGRLHSAEGPLAGAVVELRVGHPEGGIAATPGGRPLSTQVSDDGSFSLPYVEEGEHWLAILVDGELAEVRHVPGGDPIEIEKLNRIDVGEIRIER